MAESSSRMIIVVKSAIPWSPRPLISSSLLVVVMIESERVCGIMLMLLDDLHSLKLVIEIQTANAHDRFQIVPEIRLALAVGILRPRIKDELGSADIR